MWLHVLAETIVHVLRDDIDAVAIDEHGHVHRLETKNKTKTRQKVINGSVKSVNWAGQSRKRTENSYIPFEARYHTSVTCCTDF